MFEHFIGSKKMDSGQNFNEYSFAVDANQKANLTYPLYMNFEFLYFNCFEVNHRSIFLFYFFWLKDVYNHHYLFTMASDLELFQKSLFLLHASLLVEPINYAHNFRSKSIGYVIIFRRST